MTREERHIAVLNRMLESMDVYDSIQPTTERKKAIKAAIQALENHDTFMKYAYSQGKHDALSQESCDVFDKYGNYKYPSDVELTEPNTATSMPCDDAISRKKAICVISACDGKSAQIEALEQLPSVTQKSGKWIGIDEEPHEDYECSCCGYVVSTFTANIEPHTEYKYCPNCGAEMESEE